MESALAASVNAREVQESESLVAINELRSTIVELAAQVASMQKALAARPPAA
jgi:hypothetical protein